MNQKQHFSKYFKPLVIKWRKIFEIVELFLQIFREKLVIVGS